MRTEVGAVVLSISLPHRLLVEVEELRSHLGLRRSALFAEAVRCYIRSQQRREARERAQRAETA